MVTVVIAWTETISVPVGWEDCRIDLGERPHMREVPDPRAAVWLLEGTDADVAAAEHHARTISPTARVFTFDINHPDPLGAAKRAIMEAA